MKTVREREYVNTLESKEEREKERKNEIQSGTHINQTHKTRNYYDHPVTYYCRPINTHNDNKMEKRMRKNE